MLSAQQLTHLLQARQQLIASPLLSLLELRLLSLSILGVVGYFMVIAQKAVQASSFITTGLSWHKPIVLHTKRFSWHEPIALHTKGLSWHEPIAIHTKGLSWHKLIFLQTERHQVGS